MIIKNNTAQASIDDAHVWMAKTSNLDYLHINHSNYEQDKNLVQLSRNNEELKEHIISLANNGFLMYKSDNKITSFVKTEAIHKLWHRIKSNEFSCDENNIVYQLTQPELNTTEKKLLVILSSISNDIYQPSIMRHFHPNFKTIQKYIPKNVLILRIADIGSVVGSFYLNTNYLPNNEKNIINLIKCIASKNNISNDDIILLGVSKGATGALYHSVQNDIKSVCVDPILSDEYYEEKHRDSHFTKRTFPKTKQDIFFNLNEHKYKNKNKKIVIYSQNSPQYTYINKFKDSYTDVYFINNKNSSIKDHPEVAPNSMHLITMFLNMHFSNIDMSKNHMDVDY